MRITRRSIIEHPNPRLRQSKHSTLTLSVHLLEGCDKHMVHLKAGSNPSVQKVAVLEFAVAWVIDRGQWSPGNTVGTRTYILRSILCT